MGHREFQVRVCPAVPVVWCERGLADVSAGCSVCSRSLGRSVGLLASNKIWSSAALKQGQLCRTESMEHYILEVLYRNSLWLARLALVGSWVIGGTIIPGALALNQSSPLWGQSFLNQF